MSCYLCKGEVEPAIVEMIEEANAELVSLGKPSFYEPTCGDCLALIFGEISEN